MASSHSMSRSLHQTADDFFRRENFSGNFARLATAAFVVAFNHVHRFQKIVEGFEAEQALALWNEPAEPRFLCDDRSSRRVGRKIVDARIVKVIENYFLRFFG